MSVQDTLHPTHAEKTLGAVKAERTIKRITFECSEANPGEALYVSVPKLNVNEVLVPGSLALIFNINLAGGNANNFLVQNVSRALVDKTAVKFAGTTLQDMVGYDIFKIWEDLFLAQEDRGNMLLVGIQTENSERSAQMPGTKIPRKLTQKTRWKRFSAQNTESSLTTRSSLTTASSIKSPLQPTCV